MKLFAAFAILCGEFHPVESSWTQSVVLEGKGVVIPSTGESLKPFSETAFIGISMCRGIQQACKAHHSMSKGHSYRKQILSIDNN